MFCIVDFLLILKVPSKQAKFMSAKFGKKNVCLIYIILRIQRLKANSVVPAEMAVLFTDNFFLCPRHEVERGI